MRQIADYYRERKIGCVIFSVDFEAQSGFRRYPNEEVAELAAENSDIMIAFGSDRSGKGSGGRKGSAAADPRLRSQGLQVPSLDTGIFPE